MPRFHSKKPNQNKNILLKDKGYKYLTIDAIYKLDADLRATPSDDRYSMTTLRVGKDDGGDLYLKMSFDTWSTWKISLKGIIEKYDAVFNNTGTNRRVFVVSTTRTNAVNAALDNVFYTLYMTGFEFTKA